jgi:hypothetical protein
VNLYIDPDGNFPRYKGDVALAQPGWEPGSPLPEGWREVVSTPVPESPGKRAVFAEPKDVNGVLYASYELVDSNIKDISQMDQEHLAKSGLKDLFRIKP